MKSMIGFMGVTAAAPQYATTRRRVKLDERQEGRRVEIQRRAR
jgi:hypothetical protein